MSDLVQNGSPHRAPLAFLDRTAIVVALAFALALFLNVGRLAVERADPLAPITLLFGGAVWVALLIAGLAVIVASGSTLLAARRFPDIGPFCAAIAIGALSLQGGTAEALLVEAAATGTPAVRGLAGRFLVESLVWFMVVGCAIPASAFVLRRLAPGGNRARTGAASSGLLPSGMDLPFLRRPNGTRSTGRQTAVSAGLKHLLIAAGVGLLAMTVLSAGAEFRAVRHGQVCFTVAAGIAIGTYTAMAFAPVCSALWSILATPLTAVAGYTWAMWSTMPIANPVARILPVQFICVGMAAAILTAWYHFDGSQEADPNAAPSVPSPAIGAGS